VPGRKAKARETSETRCVESPGWWSIFRSESNWKWALAAKVAEDEITGQSPADIKLSTRERRQRGDENRETAGKRPTAMCDLRKKVVQSGLAGKTGKHYLAKAG